MPPLDQLAALEHLDMTANLITAVSGLRLCVGGRGRRGVFTHVYCASLQYVAMTHLTPCRYDTPHTMSLDTPHTMSLDTPHTMSLDTPHTMSLDTLHTMSL